MKDLDVREQETDGVLVLVLEGFLDAHTAPAFEKTLAAAVDRQRHRIVVHCPGLTYISSTGLGVFMAFLDRIREAGGDIKLAGVPPKIYKVFDLLGFPQLLEFHATLPEALARFGTIR